MALWPWPRSTPDYSTVYRLYTAEKPTVFTEGVDYITGPYTATNQKFGRYSMAVIFAAVAALVPGATDAAPHSNQWTSTAAVTNATSAVATTLIGAGKGTLTMPLASLAVGSTFVLEAHGVVGTAASAGAPTILIKLGSVTIATIAPTLGNSLSAVPWKLRAVVTITTAGAAGVVNIGGEFLVHPTATTLVAAGFSAAVTSVALDAAKAFNITNTWSASDAANTITLRTLTIDRVR